MKFYGRETQRRNLHRLFRRTGHKAALIYGRRRVGKSAGLKCYRYGFISRSGFHMSPEDNMIFIHLKDIYA